MSCGIGCKRGLDPTLLWLRCRLAVIAPIGSLAWELPYAMGVVLRLKKKKKTVKYQKFPMFPLTNGDTGKIKQDTHITTWRGSWNVAALDKVSCVSTQAGVLSATQE